MRNFVKATLATGLLAASLVACAADVGEIDRVQPNYVKKSDLLGKSWYYRRTVVDAPENMGPYATVGTGDLFTIERIRFDVTQDLLVAYRDYEYVPGSEERTWEGNTTFQGSPVVAFPIESHFDIDYTYSPTTGERSNERVENTSDRLWYERDFIRVNWASTKLSQGNYFLLPVDFLDTDGSDGGHYFAHPDDATNPDRARLTPEKGYVDFVNEHIVLPDPYTCLYDYDFSIYDAIACGGGEIRVRHAFMQVDEAQNAAYEALNYPDSVVLTDEAGNEITDDATGEVMREPIFDRFGFYRLEKLTYDNLRELTESGRLNRIIRFNIWDRSLDAAGNEIPYAQRQVRPIIYYLNWDFPEELRATAHEVAAEWNDVFKDTVASLQGRQKSQVADTFILRDNDCSVPNARAYAAAHPDVHDLAHASVGAELSAENLVRWCAALEYHSRDLTDGFTFQQMGDPRYNMMYWVTQIIPAAFSGYGPMLGDPTSGRNVVSTAYVLGWTIDNAAIRALEYIDYMNGEIQLGDLLLGENVPNMFFEGDYDPRATTFSADEVQMKAQKMLPAAKLEDLDNRFSELGDTFEELMVPLENSSYYDDRLARIKGTALEKNNLLRPEDLMLASRGEWQPGMPVSDELYEQASFVNRVRGIRQKREHTNRFLQERTMCPMADLDDALVGLAKQLKDLPRADRLLKLRQAVFKAVMLHEVGHNVGLRHNFQGSYDALNYAQEQNGQSFWGIEEQLGTDEVAKLDASQPEYKYSSIMDYHGKVNGDFRGLGRYDRAAIKFGYGQIIETFTDTNVQGGKAMRTWLWENDYRKIPQHLGGVAGINARQDEIFDWTEPLNASKVNALLDREVPYMFCSDEYANMIPECRRFDFGANQREIQQAAYVRYKNYFIFSNFLRGRLVLDFDRATMRGYTAFLESLMTYQYMYLYRAKDPTFFEKDVGKDFATAVADGLNLMGEVIAMPRPDVYFRCENPLDMADVTYYPSSFLNWDTVNDPLVATGPDNENCDMTRRASLPVGAAYPMFFGFSEEWYTWTFTYLGTYWDKLFALQELTDPTATYFRVNMDEDIRNFSVSFYRLYNEELNDILLSLINYDRKGVASHWDEANERLLPREIVDLTGAQVQPRLVPALTRNLQLYSILYGMAFLTSSLDETLDFAKHARIAVKGSADDFFDAAGLPGIVECTLPESGITYRAAQTSSESSNIDIARTFVGKCGAEATVRSQRLTEWEAAAALVAATPTTDPGYEALVDDAEDKRFRFDVADGALRETEQMVIFMHELNQVYQFGM